MARPSPKRSPFERFTRPRLGGHPGTPPKATLSQRLTRDL